MREKERDEEGAYRGHSAGTMPRKEVIPLFILMLRDEVLLRPVPHCLTLSLPIGQGGSVHYFG